MRINSCILGFSGYTGACIDSKDIATIYINVYGVCLTIACNICMRLTIWMQLKWIVGRNNMQISK